MAGPTNPPAPPAPPATPPATPPADDPRPYTQAEIDQIVQQRLAREKSKYADYDDLKAKATKLEELEGKDKTEAQRLAEELNTTKSSASMTQTELLQLQVALEKAPEGMTPADVAKYAKRLKGATREELETDADEFFASLPGGSPTGGNQPPARKPNERLQPGGPTTDGDADPDVDDIVSKVARR